MPASGPVRDVLLGAAQRPATSRPRSGNVQPALSRRPRSWAVIKHRDRVLQFAVSLGMSAARLRTLRGKIAGALLAIGLLILMIGGWAAFRAMETRRLVVDTLQHTVGAARLAQDVSDDWRATETTLARIRRDLGSPARARSM